MFTADCKVSPEKLQSVTHSAELLEDSMLTLCQQHITLACITPCRKTTVYNTNSSECNPVGCLPIESSISMLTETLIN